jgi:SAM-dependent methyltransferase
MDDATDLFASTAAYYARYRPGYPAAVLDRIRAAFGLDGTGRLLDLGCGTGELARALHGDFTDVVGVDVSAEMLAEARRQAARAGIANIRWVQLPAEEISGALGRFRLVTLGNAFHWMRRDVVLDRAYDLLEAGGGIAILGNPGVWTGEDAWERAAHDVVVRWLGPRRRTRAGFFADEEGAEKVALARSRFVGMEAGDYRWSRPVDVDTILGGFFSTSFASRALLGDRADDFAADLRRALLALDPTGRFVQRLITDYLFGHKR